MNISVERIERFIFVIRGQKVVLAANLAVLYGVPTLRLNEQVKRNKQHFPEDFVFQLTSEEDTALTSQIAISKKGRGGRRIPRAVEMSVQVVRAFVRLRQMLATHTELARKLAELERKFEGHDEAIHNLFETIRQLLVPPPLKRRKIGFHVKERV